LDKSILVEELQRQAHELQRQITELHKKLEATQQQLAAKIAESEATKQKTEELQKQLSNSTELQTPTLPDLESIRDSVLGNWKVAKRAESKERIKQAIDRFISQLQNDASMQPFMQPLNGQDDELETAPSWESRALSFLGGASWDG
jgi:regulator of replication initiation timing